MLVRPGGVQSKTLSWGDEREGGRGWWEMRGRGERGGGGGGRGSEGERVVVRGGEGMREEGG